MRFLVILLAVVAALAFIAWVATREARRRERIEAFQNEYIQEARDILVLLMASHDQIPILTNDQEQRARALIDKYGHTLNRRSDS